VFLKGLETLRLRMQAHCASAQALAQWLEQQPQVAKVYYAGLASHPQHELAKRQQSGFGAVVSFEVVGGKEAAWRFIDATRLISITANLGDSKTTITHPATTTHGRLSVEDRAAAGIRDSLIRLAIGLEDVVDLQADLARGLAAL
jgi:O-succinylhomoserine sulfhydrylase